MLLACPVCCCVSVVFLNLVLGDTILVVLAGSIILSLLSVTHVVNLSMAMLS